MKLADEFIKKELYQKLEEIIKVDYEDRNYSMNYPVIPYFTGCAIIKHLENVSFNCKEICFLRKFLNARISQKIKLIHSIAAHLTCE